MTKSVIDKAINPIRLLGMTITLLMAIVITPIISYFSFKEAVAEEISKVKLNMAENYIKKREVKEDMNKLRKSVEDLTKAVYTLQGSIPKSPSH